MNKVYKLNNADGSLVIMDEDRFETANLCDCYDEYGQQNGCTDSGCYAVSNDYCDAKKECLAAVKSKFGVDAEIECGIVTVDNEEIEEITSFVEDWKKENEVHVDVQAYTFWDGHNHKTLVLSTDIWEPNIEEVNEELSTKIISAFEKCEFDNWNFGKCASTSGGYRFTQTQYCDDPYIACVEEDIETEI
jgi:hypothetical protein